MERDAGARIPGAAASASPDDSGWSGWSNAARTENPGANGAQPAVPTRASAGFEPERGCGPVYADTLARWLDWPSTLAGLEKALAEPGEIVRAAEGSVSSLYDAPAGPQVVPVSLQDGFLVVDPGDLWTRDAVAQRFHLKLEMADIVRRMEEGGFGALASSAGWVRHPAAASVWAYCVAFLRGDTADSPSVRCERLGQRLVDRSAAPAPPVLLAAGVDEVGRCGIVRSRAENLLRLAEAFYTGPDRYKGAHLQRRPADAVIRELGRLPHIGRLRAEVLACGAVGHDDVLVDLSRRDACLQSVLGLTWAEIRVHSERVRPYRSLLSDRLQTVVEAAT
jgi:3-methyladenine DNA glycosylase/8-oxoguanine DNA glycosylase